MACAAAAAAALLIAGGHVSEAAAASTQVVVTPSADTYVNAAATMTSYATSTLLRVRPAPYTNTTYLKFAVSGVTGTVTSARLRLYVSDATSNGGTVHRVASTTWTEGLTWWTAPVVTATALATVGPAPLASWVDVQLGSAVTGNGTYSFAVKGVSTDPGAYTSREGTIANRPQLVLSVSTGPSAPVNTAAPAVAGAAEEGQALTATPGLWAADPPATYAYSWRRCDALGGACSDIPGASSSTYNVSLSDVGTTLRARVTASNSAGSGAADSAATPVVRSTSLTLPVRAGFYYGWYPENWVPGMNYTPSSGLYSSSSTTVIKKHIAAMQYARMQAGIYSWWGLQNTGNSATARFPAYLSAAQGTGFKWAVYHEPEGYGNPTAAELETDLRHIRDNYATSSSYLRVAGRPVVFAYSGVGDGCEMASRWRAANTVNAHLVLSTSWVDNSPQLASLAPHSTTAATRVAAGDLTGDGKAEVVTAPSGGTTSVNVFDGRGTRLASFVAGDPAATPGAFVAVGDVTGDGRAEIVVGSGATASPWIRVFAYAAGSVTELRSFDPAITTGVRVAVGDVTGDGRGDIVAAAGPGAPLVKIFTGEGAAVGSFAPYDASFTKGLYVSAANVTGDARAEIVLGGANGTRNEVRVLDAAGASLITPFAAYAGFGGAVSVAVGDANGDGAPDIVTGASGGPHVRSFTLRLGRPSALISFFAAPASTTGQISVASADVAGEGTADIVTGTAAGQPAQAKVFGNVRDCPDQPDDWHEYLITASGESSLGRDSFTIAPGYWWADDATAALPRDRTRWDANIQRMVASGADWQLVLSFNEWGEATSVESATAWPSFSGYGTYVDRLRAGGASTLSMAASGTRSSATGAPATGRLTSGSRTTLGVGKPPKHDVRANDPRPELSKDKPAGAANADAFPFGHRGTADTSGRSRRP